MALYTRITESVVSTLTNALDLQTPTAPLDYAIVQDLTTGTGANQADMLWTDRRTLTASATEDLDLAGSLTGPLGGTLTFARVKYLLFRALSTNTNNVNVTRPAANGVPVFLAASDGVPIVPGGWWSWGGPNAAGIAVTPATGDLITVTNSAGGTSVIYDVVIIGASA